jgi:hypothetical protein
LLVDSLKGNHNSPSSILHSPFKRRQIARQKAVFCTLKGHVLQGKRRHIGNPLAIRPLAGGCKEEGDGKPGWLLQKTKNLATGGTFNGFFM